MKVLLTATVQSHLAQFHRPLAEVLHEHNCEVHAAAKDNLAEKNGLKLDFADKVFDVPFARSPRSLDNIRAYRKLKRIIDAENYDVIHCNTPMGGVVTRLAARAARKKGTKVFYTAHGFHFFRGAPKKNWLAFYPVEKFFAGHYTDKLIAITDEDFRLAREKFKCRVEHIHGVGVDERRYLQVDFSEKRRLRGQMGYGEAQKLILCVGELLPNKNQIMAIRMMPRILETYPDAQLLIAGNGPKKAALAEAIADRKLENNAKLLGYRTDLQDIQHVADVLVSCSRREGLPLNIVEAMLSGTPVVAVHNRGHDELISDGETGFLVEQDDAEAMADRVLQILGSAETQSRLAGAAKEFAGRYGRASVEKELEKLYFG